MNKMLFCDSSDKLIVSLITVTGSHEFPECHAVHYCVQIAQFLCKKVKYCNFYQVGQVLSPNLGRVLLLTLFVIPCHIAYKQPLQIIMKLTGDQGLIRLLPQ